MVKILDSTEPELSFLILRMRIIMVSSQNMNEIDYHCLVPPYKAWPIARVPNTSRAQGGPDASTSQQ